MLKLATGHLVDELITSELKQNKMVGAETCQIKLYFSTQKSFAEMKRIFWFLWEAWMTFVFF